VSAPVAERGVVRAHVSAVDPVLRDEVVATLRAAGIAVGDERYGAVVVAAGGSVDAALAACPPGDHPLLVLADTFDPAEVLRALRAGARAMLQSTSDSTQLVAAVHSARQGDGRLPYEVLIKLLSGPAEPPVPAPSPLTARQTAVLTLMAEGHGNVAIARALSCSAHTVKNVIYDLMARLQVRNRSHAVARAVRAGLI